MSGVGNLSAKLIELVALGIFMENVMPLFVEGEPPSFLRSEKLGVLADTLLIDSIK